MSYNLQQIKYDAIFRTKRMFKWLHGKAENEEHNYKNIFQMPTVYKIESSNTY